MQIFSASSCISPEVSPPLGDGIDGPPPSNTRSATVGGTHAAVVRAPAGVNAFEPKAVNVEEEKLGVWAGFHGFHPPPHRGQFPVGGFSPTYLKHIGQNGFIFPKDRGEKKSYLKPPPRFIVVIRMVGIPTRQQRPFGASSLVLKSWLNL